MDSLNLTPRSARNYGRLALLESPVSRANRGPDSGSPSFVDPMKRLDRIDNVRELVHYSYEQENFRIKRNSALSAASDTTVATVTSLQGRKFLVGPYELGKDLGDGASGCVRLARNKVTGHNVAIKIIDKTGPREVIREKKFGISRQPVRMSSGDIEEKLAKEIIVLKMIRHPFIARVYDVYESLDSMFIVLEYVSGGELFAYIKEKGPLQEAEAIRIFRQIVSGIGYCQAFRVCHRDLKPENILLDEKNNVKIVDFGMAALEPRGHWLKSRCGSPHYAAPEIMMQKGYEGSKADIWSCGIILFALLSGGLPYSNSSNNILAHILFDGYEMPEDLSPGMKDLINRLLVVNPDDRITIPEIWQHPIVHRYAPINSLTGEEMDRGPQVPSIEEMALIGTMSNNLDPDICNSIVLLWPNMTLEHLQRQLTNDEPNAEKRIYYALFSYREEEQENFSGPVRRIGHQTSYQELANRSANTNRTSVIVRVPRDEIQCQERPVSTETVNSLASLQRRRQARRAAADTPATRINNFIAGNTDLVRTQSAHKRVEWFTNRSNRTFERTTSSSIEDDPWNDPDGESLPPSRNSRNYPESPAREVQRRKELLNRRSTIIDGTLFEVPDGEEIYSPVRRNGYRRNTQEFNIYRDGGGDDFSWPVESVQGSSEERNVSTDYDNISENYSQGCISENDSLGDFSDNDDQFNLWDNDSQDQSLEDNNHGNSSEDENQVNSSDDDNHGNSSENNRQDNEAINPSSDVPIMEPVRESGDWEFFNYLRDTENITNVSHATAERRRMEEEAAIAKILDRIRQESRQTPGNSSNSVQHSSYDRSGTMPISGHQRNIAISVSDNANISDQSEAHIHGDTAQESIIPAPLNVRRKSVRDPFGRVVKNPDLQDEDAPAHQGIVNPNFLAPGLGGQDARPTLKPKRSFYDLLTGKKSSKEGKQLATITGTRNHSAAQQSNISHGGGLFETIGKRVMRHFHGQRGQYETLIERLDNPEIVRFSLELEPIEATSFIPSMNEVDFDEVVVHKNWLYRMLKINAATRTVCFHISATDSQDEIIAIWKQLEPYGLRILEDNRHQLVVRACVMPTNLLGLKEVTVLVEIRVYDDGHNYGQAVVRFAQERGAASSFNRIMEITEQCFEEKDLLVTNKGACRQMKRRTFS
ncbi:Non-specific serine threonine protein kinase [Rhizina undulata]